MELNATQLLLIGLAATVVIQILKLVADRFTNLPINKITIGIVSVVVSLILAFIFVSPKLPPLGDDPMTFLSELFSVAAGIVGWATVIYNILLSKILDGLGLQPKGQPEDKREPESFVSS